MAVARAIAVALLTVCLALVLALPVAVKTSVQLLATYALKGTQVPVLNITTDEAIRQLAIRYVRGTYGTPPLPVIAVNYPASLRPFSPGGFSDPTFNQSVAMGLAELQRDTAADPAPVIFGYSQGATVGTEYKEAFNRQFANPAPGTTFPRPTWVFIGNPNRPNGGLFERFDGLYVPLFDVTFTGATPTETAGATPGLITTYDISGQYDLISDFPNYPLNLLADANAVAGAFYVHLNYPNVDMTDAVLQDRFGDTAYYLIPTKRLPLLMPLAQLGVPDPLLAVLDAPLRVLVEAGYDRTISPGQPTTASLLLLADPVATAVNFLLAIPTGFDDGLEEIGLGRPFGTTAAGPYGVGGPPVTLPGNAATTPSTPQPSSLVTAARNLRAAPSAMSSPVEAGAPQPAKVATAQALTSRADNSASGFDSLPIRPTTSSPHAAVASESNGGAVKRPNTATPGYSALETSPTLAGVSGQSGSTSTPSLGIAVRPQHIRGKTPSTAPGQSSTTSTSNGASGGSSSPSTSSRRSH